MNASNHVNLLQTFFFKRLFRFLSCYCYDRTVKAMKRILDVFFESYCKQYILLLFWTMSFTFVEFTKYSELSPSWLGVTLDYRTRNCCEVLSPFVPIRIPGLSVSYEVSHIVYISVRTLLSNFISNEVTETSTLRNSLDRWKFLHYI